MAIPMRHLRDGSSGLRPMLQEMAWLYQPLDHWDRNIDIYLDEVMALTRYSLEGKTLAQLWSYIHRIRDIAYRNFTPNIAIAQGHAMLMRALTATVTALAGAERSNVLMSELTTGCKTKTGLFNEELKSLAALVASRPGLEERVRHDASQEALDAILADAEASAAFERFLSAHYHREIDHFLDPYYPSLGERPLVLVDNIKMRLDAAGRLDTNKSTNRHRQALATIMSLCPKDHRPDLLELVELTRTYVGLDDTEHYQTGRLHTPTRRCMRAIGRMLVEAGLIEEELDVCFAGFDALEKAVLHNFWGELVADVRANKASFLKACSSPPPWSLEQRSEDAAGDGSVYIGLACSSGVVEGVVKIVRTSDDFRNIRPGDILVARATPPAWTALFYSVAGVITEAGSALSHGAVIAREVGIPAVMGLRGILDAFQDGDRVRVDGSAGRVFRLIESAPRTDP
jgi:pyruvate,water dikinase